MFSLTYVCEICVKSITEKLQFKLKQKRGSVLNVGVCEYWRFFTVVQNDTNDDILNINLSFRANARILIPQHLQKSQKRM